VSLGVKVGFPSPPCQSCWQADASATDNHMINGTKLLNVAGMTRGRRDGILKSEKIRHVVKIGPMHLKGVWYVHGAT
jgi:protein SOK2